MTKSIILKVAGFLLAVFVCVNLSFYAEAPGQNFKLFTDVLDGFGGRASSTNFSERIGSGGQPGVVGISEDSSFFALQGYVHTAAFVHGDCDGDGQINVVDLVYLVNYVFKTGPEPIPLETGDVDCPGNNVTDVVDVVYLVNYVFKSGPPPCNF